jgi:dihydrolipoamide dehydrogenase
MKVHDMDVAILGAGTAGLGAYKAASKHTDRILLIDGGPLGTTCARVGCMPSKLLIAAAEAAHRSRHSDIFGVTNSQTIIDGKAVMARVQRERDRFVNFVLESIDGIPEARKIDAYGEFLDDNTLQLSNGDRVKAKAVVIATGSRPKIPPLLRDLKHRLLDTDKVFELTDLPKKMAVLGPGVIGLELGQAFSRLGVEIKLFGVSGGIGGIKDPAVKDYALKTFADEFYLDAKAQVESVEEVGDKVHIHFVDREGKRAEEIFDYVLATTGRAPNIDQLGLANTTLSLNDRGMPAFDPFTMQCGDTNIFLVGDVNSDRPLLHEASDEGRIAGENAAQFPTLRAGLRRAPIAIVFSDPQIASIGLNIEQVKLRCNDCYAYGEVSFEDQGRSRVMAENKGLLHVYGEHGTGLFLGAEMIGPRAEHIAHLLSWAVQQRMTVAQMLEMPFYHPVVEEGLRTALRDLNAKLKIGPENVKDCMETGPGA